MWFSRCGLFSRIYLQLELELVHVLFFLIFFHAFACFHWDCTPGTLLQLLADLPAPSCGAKILLNCSCLPSGISKCALASSSAFLFSESLKWWDPIQWAGVNDRCGGATVPCVRLLEHWPKRGSAITRKGF